MNIRRNTVQRQIILETLKKLRTHPTVEEVFLEIHKNHPTISKTTVYRNLRQLAECGEIRQIFLPDELDRFEGRTKQHYHFKCKTCGGISDVDIAYQAEINGMVEKKYGFQVDEHDLVFQGTCPKCSEQLLYQMQKTPQTK